MWRGIWKTSPFMKMADFSGRKKKTVSGHSADICLSAWFFKFSGIGMNLYWDAGDRSFLQEEVAHVSVEIWVQEEMLGLQEQGRIPASQPVGLWCHTACRTSWIHPCFFETEGTFLEKQQFPRYLDIARIRRAIAIFGNCWVVSYYPFLERDI